MGAKKSKVLRDKDHNLLTNHFNLSEDQINIILDRFDGNSLEDGTLNKKKFIRLYSKLRSQPTEKMEKIAGHIFNAFDKDQSGTLSFHEFLIGFSKTTTGSPRIKLAYAFDMYDQDRDGFMEKKEMETVVEAMLIMLGSDDNDLTTEKSKEMVTKGFDVLDSNGDGKISKDEFIEGLLAHYNLRVTMSPFN